MKASRDIGTLTVRDEDVRNLWRQRSRETTLTCHLLERLGPDQVSVLAFDAYYRDQGHLSPADRSLVNYDHPDSLDHERFAADVEAL